MIRKAISLLLCLLLSGCAAQNPQPEETTPSPASVSPAETAPAIASLSLDALGEGLFSLSSPVTGILPLGDGLLLFSGEETTILTLADPETMEPLAVHTLPFSLTAEDASLQRLDSGLSYFDAAAAQTVVLDTSLREIRRINAPEGLQGIPLLSADRRELFYCTADAIRVLELDSGLNRVLKAAADPGQSLSGLLEDSILQVSIAETDGSRTLFLSATTGQLLQELEGNISVKTAGTGFFLQETLDELPLLLFGDASGDALVLNPRLTPDTVFFTGSHILTASAQEDGLCLDLYSAADGQRTATLSLQAGQQLQDAAETADGSLWLLWHREDGVQLLQCWQPSPLSDSSCYSLPYHTRQNPDHQGLAACALYAGELSEKHGIEILVYRDATAVEPPDHLLTYEHQVFVLQRELDALDLRLGQLPEGFLDTLAEKFTALRICLVRSVESAANSGSGQAASGLSFLDGFDAYILLPTGQNTQYALYHQLSLLMETVVLTESAAFDRWDNLNPPDFSYGADQQDSDWSKYFIDEGSMTSAREDRAQLFAYAMTDDHEELFASPNLQAKLRQLCIGIREGFGLKNHEGPLPWEQYLTQE